MAKLKVVHYINQFFAQIGGEEKADSCWRDRWTGYGIDTEFWG